MLEEYRSKTFVVIPAKDEAKYISNVIQKILHCGYTNIVVVDDGSSDETYRIASTFAQVYVLKHRINLGPGAGTYTGIKFAVKQGAQAVVTIDADNQHDSGDIDILVQTLFENKADMVLGSRFMKENKIPTSRVFYNKIGNLVSYFISGVYLSDSQSGIKAMSHRLCSQLDIRYNGFEFCIEIIKQAKIAKAKIIEIPVNVRYSRETMRKGQNLLTGVNMVARLLKPF